MRKIVRQQNYLKELIDAQGNRFIAKQTLKCLVRSVLEPLLDKLEDGAVLYRIENKDGLQGLLKRLEFSELESVDYSDKSGNLIEKVWANTEFIVVMTHRFVSVLIWDSNTGDKDLVRYYSLYNSKSQNEPLDIIRRNSKVDIALYQGKYTPDRRDNVLLNASLRKLLENMEESASDAVLGYAEQSAETFIDSDFVQKKSRVIAHEIKNQLSICDLYTGIIKKYIDAETVDKDAINKAIKAINKSLSMANNSLLSLKTKNNSELKPVALDAVVQKAVELACVYADGKNIEIQLETHPDIEVLADAEKLTAVIINLIKNAVEAFPIEENDECIPQNGKYIKIIVEKEDDFAEIFVSNNAPGIKDTEKIFNEGFTTKLNGTGIGLWICKKSIEEQLGQLELTRSSEDYTEFTIRLGLVGRE